MVVLLQHEQWKNLECVEQSGSSWKPQALRSEHGLRPAGLQSVASNSRPPENTGPSVSGRVHTDTEVTVLTGCGPDLYDVVLAVFTVQRLHSTDI